MKENVSLKQVRESLPFSNHEILDDVQTEDDLSILKRRNSMLSTVCFFFKENYAIHNSLSDEDKLNLISIAYTLGGHYLDKIEHDFQREESDIVNAESYYNCANEIISSLDFKSLPSINIYSKMRINFIIGMGDLLIYRDKIESWKYYYEALNYISELHTSIFKENDGFEKENTVSRYFMFMLFTLRDYHIRCGNINVRLYRSLLDFFKKYCDSDNSDKILYGIDKSNEEIFRVDIIIWVNEAISHRDLNAIKEYLSILKLFIQLDEIFYLKMAPQTKTTLNSLCDKLQQTFDQYQTLSNIVENSDSLITALSRMVLADRVRIGELEKQVESLNLALTGKKSSQQPSNVDHPHSNMTNENKQVSVATQTNWEFFEKNTNIHNENLHKENGQPQESQNFNY